MDKFNAFYRSLEVDHIEIMNPQRPLNGEGTVYYKGAYTGYSMKTAWMDDKMEGGAIIYAPNKSVFAEFTFVNGDIVDVLTYPTFTSISSNVNSFQVPPSYAGGLSNENATQQYLTPIIGSTTMDPNWGYKRPDPQVTSVASTPSTVVSAQPSVMSTPSNYSHLQPTVLSASSNAVITQSSMVTPKPSVVTTQPIVPTTQPGVVTTQPAVLNTQPIVPTTQPIVPTTQPIVVTTQPGLVTTEASMTAQPNVVTTQTGIFSTQSTVTTQPSISTYSNSKLPLERKSLTHRCLQHKSLFWTIIGIVLAALILIIVFCVYLSIREESVELTSDRVRVPKNVKVIIVRELESGSQALTKVELTGLPKVTSFTATYMSFPRISSVSLTSNFDSSLSV